MSAPGCRMCGRRLAEWSSFYCSTRCSNAYAGRRRLERTGRDRGGPPRVHDDVVHRSRPLEELLALPYVRRIRAQEHRWLRAGP